jgi:excisionase family DNA binding protein
VKQANGAIDRHTKFADLPEMLSVDEYAAYNGIGRSTVYELVRTGKLAHRRFGRIVRIFKTEAHMAEKP